MSKTAITQESTLDYLIDELKLSETKEDFLMAFWIYWVESVTITSREFSQVLASATVNRWFLMELRKEEVEFKLLSSAYSQLEGHGEEIDLLYIKCISKLMSRFPLALLSNAKRRLQKPQTTKVGGVRIETSILNLN